LNRSMLTNVFVGGWSVGLGEGVDDRPECPGEVLRATAATVSVRICSIEMPCCEEGSGPEPEADGGRRLLVGEHFGVGQMAVAVDSGMDEGIAINGCLALGVMIQPGPSPDPPALPLGIRPGFLTSRWTSSPGRLIPMAVSRKDPLEEIGSSRFAQPPFRSST
jgi:hypothetical protein